MIRRWATTTAAATWLAVGLALAPAATADRPALTDPHPCADTPGFTCSTLRVPLDHDRRVPGHRDLAVATADNAAAPRGTLLVLTGGPGQPGVSLVNRVKRYFAPEVLREYRLVMFDQRGTGAGAIDCPALQAATGGSDFLTPPAEAVVACGDQLGISRNFHRSTDTVRDVESLRRALGERRLTLDGVSYGTFTAERYALAYPRRVARVVLDSVVPHSGFDPFDVDGLGHTGEVLRKACAADASCTTDPADDLAWLVRHGKIDGKPIDGTRLFESITIMSLSTINPTFDGIPELLHAARAGDTAGLAQFLDQATSIGTPADQLSAGLHQATICADLRFPWGDASAPMRGRQRALDRAASRLDPAELWPFDVRTARSVLPISGCLVWPRSKPSERPRRDRITAPTLLLSGEHDLFCPTEWARWEADRAPRSKLVVVPNEGHGVQGSARPEGRAEATAFLLGRS